MAENNNITTATTKELPTHVDIIQQKLKLFANKVVKKVKNITNTILDPNSDPGLYEALVMKSSNPMIAYDKNGKLIVWNKGAEEFFECPFDEVKGLTADEILIKFYKWDDYEEARQSVSELHRTWEGYSKKLFTATTWTGKKKIARWDSNPYKGWTIRSGKDETEHFMTKWMLLKDPNFGCFNRMWLLDALTQSITIKKIPEKRNVPEINEKKIDEKTNQPRESYSFAFWDIDNFKEFNDKYGHAIGDIVLKKLVEFYQKHLRESDVVSRYGWDEFILILKDSNKTQTLLKLNTLREKFSRFSFERKLDGTINEVFHDSRSEAEEYIKQKEKEENEAKTGSVFFWAIGTSWWVSDIVYDKEKWQFDGYDLLPKNYKESDTLGLVYHDDKQKEQKKEEAIIVLNHKKAEADRVLLAVKYIELLDEERKWKNGVWVFMYDEAGRTSGVNVQYDDIEIDLTLAELVELEKRRAKIEVKRK